MTKMILLPFDEVITANAENNLDSANPEGIGTSFVFSGLDDGDTLTISAGSEDSFGDTGPVLQSRITMSGITEGSVIAQSAGRATMSAGTNGLPTVKDVAALPYGKGTEIGTDDSVDNSTNYKLAKVVDTQVEEEFYESYIIYWPEANQDNAAPELDGAASWQIKPLWTYDTAANPSPSDKSDIFAGFPFWFASGLYWASGSKITSNSTPVSSTDTTPTRLLPSAQSTRYRENVMYRQFWVRSGTSVADPTGSKGMYRITDEVTGLIEEKLYEDVQFADDGATSLGWDRFTYPGFVRGFNKPLGAELYIADVYRAVGAGAAARVEITDNADYSLSKKSTHFTMTSWSDT